MKRSTVKTKNNTIANHKISSYFTKISINSCNSSTLTSKVNEKGISKAAADKGRQTILEPINNLPQCSSSINLLPVTPPRAKRKHLQRSPSPDVIPSSIDSIDTKIMRSKKLFRNSISKSECKLLIRDKTPNKSHHKLFNKSPKSLHDFNVGVLEAFVKIGLSSADLVAQKAAAAQNSNESTPTKLSSSPKIISPTQHTGVRTKLNFNSEMKIDNVQDLLNDSWESDWNSQNEILHSLDLNKLQHCKIVNIERFSNKIKMLLASIHDQSSGMCFVEGFWCNMKMECEDVICISAIYDNQLSAWNVSNNHGMIVYKPDFLISTTSVIGARFCLRRNVFNEYYRGFDSSNRVMVVGILVHQLFQEVLRRKAANIADIHTILKNLLQEKETIYMLYESCLEINEVIKEIEAFVPQIITFMKDYMVHPITATNKKKDNWKGTIDTIQDIEENIWCPELGLKGKVDVSVVRDAVTYPLEIKTGRATLSLEHRGQVMLYIMMMMQLGYNVMSGLLLYLREGILREISIGNVEKRDLILLRNELAYYLSRHADADKVVMELPEPINHHSACSMCPYNVICCTYLRYENFELDSNPLKLVQENILSHLQPQHLDYFIKWSLLLRLEASCTDGTKQVKEIYTSLPEKREKKGQCIAGLNITSTEEYRNRFYHTFKKSDNLSNLLTFGLNLGDYVVVSTDVRPAISSGILTRIDFTSVTVNLDRNLTIAYRDCKFHLDTYNSSISQTFNMANLGLLLEASKQAEKLRKIIIDKTCPTFESSLPKAVATKGVHILRKLNKNQQKAVLKALSCNDYLLIKGMPGTGKTATIVALIQILVELKKTILITSHTHSAVDNVCLRLQTLGIDLLRLGSDNKINYKLHNCSERTLTQNCTTVEQLSQVYNNAQVVAVTCLGSGHHILSKRTFDICIIDESTQILQCSVIRALYASQKFILIGDPNQLPPVVKSHEASARGLSQSLFEHLDMPLATVTLTYNYRMNKPITDMANALTYNGELLIANESISNATLHLNLLNKNNGWIRESLNPDLFSSVKVLDTGPVWMQMQLQILDTNLETARCSNRFESALVVKLIDALTQGGIHNNEIGIIAPFRAQVALISSVLPNKEIEVSTVDQYQGRDKDVIIYSCTKSAEHLSLDIKNEILEDRRRLTVAITRAKKKFILIGDLTTVRRYSPFAKLLNFLGETCFITLKDGELEFYWDELML